MKPKEKNDSLSIWIRRVNIVLIWSFMIYLAAVGYATVIEHVYFK